MCVLVLGLEKVSVQNSVSVSILIQFNSDLPPFRQPTDRTKFPHYYFFSVILYFEHPADYK